MFANLKISTMLGSSLGCIVFLNVLMVALTYLQSGHVIDGTDFVSDNVYPTTVHANNIRINVLKNWSNSLVVADAADSKEIKKITDEMAVNTNSISESFEKLKLLITDTDERALLDATIATRKVYLDNRKHYIELVQAGTVEDAKYFLVNVLRANITEYVSLIGKLTDLQQTKLDRHINTVVSDAQTLQFANLFVGCIVVFFSLLTAIFITKNVTGKLGGEVFYATEIARQISEGNLHVNIAVIKNDSVSLVASMCAMRDRLGDIVSQIEHNAHLASEAAKRLSQTSEEVAHASHVQSNAATTTAAAVEQLTVSINEVSQSAQAAQDISLHTEQISENGRKVIHNAVASMVDIANAVQHSAQVIAVLEQHSNEVSTVVNVIKAIAEQTNLLALNAAIEAARAGEQGRGFAVVAEEVRRLAERTKQSTLEITQTIEKIQQATRNAVASMNSGVEKVGIGAELANQAGIVINDIKNSTANVVNQINHISLAIKEQSIGCVEIARNVENIAQITCENSLAVDKTSEAAHQLEHIASSLEKTIGYFHLTD